MSDMPELKPCPFCGGEPEIDFGLLHAPRQAGQEFIACPTVTCGAYAYGADAWNIRADLAPAAPKVKALVEAVDLMNLTTLIAHAMDDGAISEEYIARFEEAHADQMRALDALAALEGGDA